LGGVAVEIFRVLAAITFRADIGLAGAPAKRALIAGGHATGPAQLSVALTIVVGFTRVAKGWVVREADVGQIRPSTQVLFAAPSDGAIHVAGLGANLPLKALDAIAAVAIRISFARIAQLAGPGTRVRAHIFSDV
jgi:hypothetical protein